MGDTPMRRFRFLRIFALFFLLPCSLQAAAVTNVSFGQLDWYDQTGSLHTANSSWGRMDMTILPDGSPTSYLNVVAHAGGANAWIIQNMPVFSLSVGEYFRQSVDFDIVDLGLSEGADLSSIMALISVDATPQDVAPAGPGLAFTVSDVTQSATGGFSPFPVEVGRPAGHKARGEATDVFQHKNVPAVQEGVALCLPGSMARSLGWLNTEYNLGGTKTAQQIYEDLVALKIGQPFPETGPYAKHIQKKSDYSKPKIVTKVLDLTNRVGPIEGVEQTEGGNLIDWLRKELTTEDVELDYGHHIVTITGMFLQGDERYVKYRDDEHQGSDLLGDDSEKKAKLTFKDGKWFFRDNPFFGPDGDDFEVKMLISESVPEPSAAVLMLLGVTALAALRKRARGSSIN